MTKDLAPNASPVGPMAWTIDSLLDALHDDVKGHGLQCASLQPMMPWCFAGRMRPQRSRDETSPASTTGKPSSAGCPHPLSPAR